MRCCCKEPSWRVTLELLSVILQFTVFHIEVAVLTKHQPLLYWNTHEMIPRELPCVAATSFVLFHHFYLFLFHFFHPQPQEHTTSRPPTRSRWNLPRTNWSRVRGVAGHFCPTASQSTWGCARGRNNRGTRSENSDTSQLKMMFVQLLNPSFFCLLFLRHEKTFLNFFHLSNYR